MAYKQSRTYQLKDDGGSSWNDKKISIAMISEREPDRRHHLVITPQERDRLIAMLERTKGYVPLHEMYGNRPSAK